MLGSSRYKVNIKSQESITIHIEQDSVSTVYSFDGVDRIQDMAWSPDSEYIALGMSNGLRLFQTDNLSDHQVFLAPEQVEFHRVAFSHDGRYIAANSIYTIPNADCIAPDCRYRGILYIWDSRAGDLIGKWAHGYYNSGLVTPHFTDNGRLLLAVPLFQSDTTHLYEVSLLDFTSQLMYEIETPVQPVRSITFSADGEKIFIGGGRLPNSRIEYNPLSTAYHSYVYDTQTGTLIAELETRSVVYEGQFDNDGTILITSSNLGIQVWDVASATVTRTIESRGHVDISRDSQTIGYVNCNDISRCRLIVDLPNDNQITHTIFYEHPNYLTVQGLTVRFNDDLTYIAVAFARELYLFEL